MHLPEQLADARPYPELSKLDAKLVALAFQRTHGEGPPLAVDALAHVAGCPRESVTALINGRGLLALTRGGRTVRLRLLGLLYVGGEAAREMLLEIHRVVQAVSQSYVPGAIEVPAAPLLADMGVDAERFDRVLRVYLEDAGFSTGTRGDEQHFSVLPHDLAPDGLPQVIYRLSEKLGAPDMPGDDCGPLGTPGPFQLRWTGISVEHFRALRELRFDFPSALTTLVGVNGAGKSTALDAAAFLSRALCEGLKSAVHAENGLARIRTRGAAGLVHIEARFEVDLGMGVVPGVYEVDVDERYGQLHVELERLVVGEGDAAVTWLERRKAMAKLHDPKSGEPTVLYPPLDDLQLPLLDADIAPDIPLGICRDLSRAMLIDRDPKFAPREGEYPLFGGYEAPINRPRERWAVTIDKLLDDAVPDDDAARRLSSAMTALVPTVREVRRVVVTGEMARFEVVEIDSDIPARIDELSSGMRQMLLLATVYVHETPPALLLLEEPDAGVHVGSLPALRDLLRSISSRTVVLATTHSPVFVGLLDAGREVVVLERDARGVRVRSLAEARESKKWLQAFEGSDESYVRMASERQR